MHFHTIATSLAWAACLTGVANAAPSGSDFRTIKRSPEGVLVDRDFPNISVPNDILDDIKNILDGMDDAESSRKRGVLTKRVESQYVGFDANDQTDNDHIAQLNSGWKNAIELSSYVEQSFDNVVDSGVYGHYSADGDKDKANQAFRNVWANDDSQGSIDLGYIFWVKPDISNLCTASGSEQSGQDITLAYIGTRNQVSTSYPDGTLIGIGHVCDQPYDLPVINDGKCDDLGDTVSTKMDVLGAILLHEYMHFDRPGLPAAGFHITDNAYGPVGVYQTDDLCDQCKLLNADSYRWMALEYFWTTTCGKQFSEPRDQEDDQEDACNPGRCIIQ